MKRLRIGISSCLLGDEVRFDGGHKHDPLLTGTLGPLVEWVRVCPEVEVGMGVPREPLRLVRAGGDTRMIATRTGVDHTDSMRAFARRRATELTALGLSGYVLKKNSPSCGLTGVTLYDAGGDTAVRDGVGLYAAVLREHFPSMPIEEEERLHDPSLRREFLERALAYDRLHHG
jgi:uncharacterized protein YbbK (DUF523 family)